MGYDHNLWDAKDRVTKTLLAAAGNKPTATIEDVATAVDNLNKAWDELTKQLVRQREVMRETIDDLHRKLADERKRGV